MIFFFSFSCYNVFKVIKMNDDYFEEYREDFSNQEEMKGREAIELKGRSRRSGKMILIFFLILLVGFAVFFGIYGYQMYQNDLPPRVSEVSISSNNQEDKTKAVYGDLITLRFTFNKAIHKGPVVIINDKVVDVRRDDEGYYANYFIQDQSDRDVVVEFEIKDYEDIFGKVGKSVVETTDHSSVLIPSYLASYESE